MHLLTRDGFHSGTISMFGQTGDTTKGASQASSATFSGLWGPLYGVLQRLEVHPVQHDILWPGSSVRRIAKSTLYDVTYLLISLKKRAPHFHRTVPNRV